jgi:hypothetical protein
MAYLFRRAGDNYSQNIIHSRMERVSLTNKILEKKSFSFFVVVLSEHGE